MKSRFDLFLSSVLVVILTACGPGLAPPSPTNTLPPSQTPTHTPSPTATITPTPTLTPIPTATPIPIPDLTNEYTAEDNLFKFRYPDGWAAFDDYGSTMVMPQEYADKYYTDSQNEPDIYGVVTVYRTEHMGDLFTDPSTLEKPEDVFHLIKKSKRFEDALRNYPGVPSTFESSGYPAYEITAEGNNRYWYTAIILAEELGVAARVFGTTTRKSWQEAQPYFMAIARNISLKEAPPIEQIDPSLEGLDLPSGKEFLSDELYINIPHGFQVQYPFGWTVLENEYFIAFSLDKGHTLCNYFEGIDPEVCGTPVMITAITERGIINTFRQVSFDDPGDREIIGETFYSLVGLELLYFDTDPIEKFEINGHAAIGQSYSGTHRKDYTEFETEGNPVMGYILAVKDGDKVAVFWSMAPTRYWSQFRPLLVSVLESLEFSSEPLPPSPTPTSTPTLFPAPANKTGTAEGFTFNGIDMKILGVSLGEDCHDAHVQIYPNEDLDFLLPYYEIEQPNGTNCIMVAVSSIPGKKADPEQFQTVGGSIVGDPYTKKAYPSTIPFSVRTVMDDSGTYLVIDLYTFIPDSVTAYALILPDIRMIPLILKEK